MKRSRESEELIDTKRTKGDTIEDPSAQDDKEETNASANEQSVNTAADETSPLATSTADDKNVSKRLDANADEVQLTENASSNETSAKDLAKNGHDPAKSNSTEENSVTEEKNEAATCLVKKNTTQKPTGFSSFGFGFSGFGGFSGSGKFSAKSNAADPNPWAEPSQSTKNEDQNQTENPEDPKKNGPEEQKSDSIFKKESQASEPGTFATVKLCKQEVITGEEDEEAVFQMKVRLYAIDLAEVEEKSWKERGTGLLKLNKLEGTGKFRLVMRADGVLRVSLNILVDKNMQLTKGFPTSLHTERFVKFTGFEDGKLHQYAVRCGSESQRDELHDSIKAAFEK